MKNNIVSEPKEEWGGPWTERKLNAFSKYVGAYLRIMRKNPFWKLIYFDGFAGSGRKTKTSNEVSELYRQLNLNIEEESYKGAAERVLSLEQNFDYYYFIDKDISALQKLEQLLTKKFPRKNLVFRSSDANEELVKLANALKSEKIAALIFLDPFGMQINWNSIKQLKGTRSDLWILIPSGVIINRLLDRKGELKFSEKLESFFGLPIDEIREYFYQRKSEITLFGDRKLIAKITNPIEKIAELYIKQMKQVWKFTTERPLVLENNNGLPIFHFAFASNNKTAIKIASQIIENV